MGSQPTFQAVGECMVEIVRVPGGRARIGYSGDTYNTAVYVHRVAVALGSDLQTRFLSGIGDDEQSRLMLTRWISDGIESDALTVPGGTAGLYMISTDESGERAFSYWRDDSAAARLFEGSAWIDHVRGSIVYLSGITLQLMSAATRQALVERLSLLRNQGTRVVFDSNYRETGWASAVAARTAMDMVLAVADIALVTLDDEIALGGCADAVTCAARLRQLGVAEFAIKDGANGAWVSQGEGLLQILSDPVDPVDTTAAGDSFNGAYLAARAAGASQTEAAGIANTVAAQVVLHPGAILAEDQMPVLI